MAGEECTKFVYDENDFKIMTLNNGRKVKLYRIVALRDIQNPNCFEVISAGEKGGYIAKNTLSQDGESWVDICSIVCPDCYISGNAYVVGSVLSSDVFVGNSGVVAYSKIYTDNSKVSVFGGAIISNSMIKGSDVNMSGSSRMTDCSVYGNVSMEGDSSLDRCEIPLGSSVKFSNNTKVSNKIISGTGPYKYGEIIDISLV